MAKRKATKRRRKNVQEEEEHVSSEDEVEAESEDNGDMYLLTCHVQERFDWDMESMAVKKFSESQKVKLLEHALKLQDAEQIAKKKLREQGIFEPDPMLAELGILDDIDPNALSVEDYGDKVEEVVEEFMTKGDEGFVSKEESLYSKWVKTLDGHPLFFECPWEKGKPVTSKTIMKKAHIMLPKVSGLMADLLCKSMFIAVVTHMGGGTSIGNRICFSILRRSERAARHARESKYQLALGELWGILLFTERMDLDWAMDNELESEEWDQMLSSFSKAWNVIFAQTDAVLGWNAASRSRSIRSLKSFAKGLKEVNKMCGYEDLDLKLKIKFGPSSAK